MKILRVKAGFFVALLVIILASGGCGKKVASLSSTSPSTSKDAQTTVETDKNAKTGDEVVTEPLALLNPNISEKAIEPNDTTAGTGESNASGTSDKTGGVAGINVGKDALSGDLKDVFFDFDMTVLKDSEMNNLKNDAELLKRNHSIVVRVEGHADERGTNAYNLALGEKRAQMVRKYLAVFGISQNRVDVLSYGEEKAFCSEHNEECWAKNRRAHFVVVTR